MTTRSITRCATVTLGKRSTTGTILLFSVTTEPLYLQQKPLAAVTAHLCVVLINDWAMTGKVVFLVQEVNIALVEG